MGERWEPGDIVLAADGGLWRRTEQPGLPWQMISTVRYSRYSSETVPVRPLMLLVRSGRPMVPGDGLISDQTRADLEEVRRPHDFDSGDAPYQPEVLAVARAAE